MTRRDQPSAGNNRAASRAITGILSVVEGCLSLREGQRVRQVWDEVSGGRGACLRSARFVYAQRASGASALQ
jgi:hypothetical protein